MSVFLSNTHTPPPYNHAIFFLPVHVTYVHVGMGKLHFFTLLEKNKK